MKSFKTALCAALAVLIASAGMAAYAYGAMGYQVFLPGNLVGSQTVAAGDKCWFVVMDVDQEYYEYEFYVTVGGKQVEVKDSGLGVYVVENVTGDVYVSVTRYRKVVPVTVSGSGANWVRCADSTAYGEVFRFYADPAEVEISVTVDGEEYQTGSGSDGLYTVLAYRVTGEIVITAQKIGQKFEVTFVGSGAEDATGSMQIGEGEDYRFTLNKKAGFSYDVAASMGGTMVEVTHDGNLGYQVVAVTAPLTITITRTKDAPVEQESTPPKDNGGGEQNPTPEPVSPTPEEPAPSETPEEPVPEAEPVPEEKTEPEKPVQAPLLPDVTIGSFDKPEETENFPWWIVPVCVGTVLLAVGLILHLNRRRVIFETNGGSAVRDQRVFRGRFATRPPEPRKQGATFAGWFLDEAGSKRWIFEEKRVEEHMTLYARWI